MIEWNSFSMDFSFALWAWNPIGFNYHATTVIANRWSTFFKFQDTKPYVNAN